MYMYIFSASRTLQPTPRRPARTRRKLRSVPGLSVPRTDGGRVQARVGPVRIDGDDGYAAYRYALGRPEISRCVCGYGFDGDEFFFSISLFGRVVCIHLGLTFYLESACAYS
jgi:hypothetical protein